MGLGSCGFDFRGPYDGGPGGLGIADGRLVSFGPGEEREHRTLIRRRSLFTKVFSPPTSTRRSLLCGASLKGLTSCLLNVNDGYQ